VTSATAPVEPRLTEGERWARELLAELRDAHFTPSAWIAFLTRSFVRAAERRRERPGLWHETLALGAAGLAVWAGAGAAGRPDLALAGGLWWLAVCLMLGWHLGMVERPDGRPLPHLGIANVLSVLRAGLIPVLPVLSPAGLAVALAAAHATDVLDGQAARRRDEVTRLGQWLDGAVDSVLVPVAAVSAVRLDLVPVWAAALAIVRYAIPAFVVAAAYFVRAAPPPRRGHVPGRVPGFLLLLGLVLAGFDLPGATPLAVAGAAGGVATFAATVLRMLHAALAAQPRAAQPALVSADESASGARS
jgi:phosphatidylglycerophosphate synthase